jgi:L-threonylcarbamoyladenylate synthase
MIEDAGDKQLTQQEAEYFGKKIRDGEVVAFPTETVYGLGANVFDEKAVAKIFVAKNRPADNPLIVHIYSLDQLPLVAQSVTPTELSLFRTFSPGPLTVLVQKKSTVPAIVTAGSPLVGVRLPNHVIAQQLLVAAKTPIAAPSANKSGKPSATHHQHVVEAFGSEVPNVIKAGKTTLGVESTVVLVRNENEIIVMRQGAISVEEIQEKFPDFSVHLVGKKDHEVTASPGTRYRHYAPKGEIVVLPADSTVAGNMMRELAHSTDISNGESAAFYFEAIQKVMVGNNFSIETVVSNSSEALQLLFDFLLQCDKLDSKKIVIQLSDGTGVGATYNERVLRAAGKI